MKNRKQQLASLISSHFESGKMKMSELLALMEILGMFDEGALLDGGSAEGGDESPVDIEKENRKILMIAETFRNDFPVLIEFLDKISETSLSEDEKALMEVFSVMLKKDPELANKMMNEAPELRYELDRLVEKIPEIKKYLN